MFHLINFVADAFLLALATVTVPSVFFGLIAIAADRYRQGQQTDTALAPEPQQTFAIPEVSEAQAADFAQADPLATEPVKRTAPASKRQTKAPATTQTKETATPATVTANGTKKTETKAKAAKPTAQKVNRATSDSPLA